MDLDIELIGNAWINAGIVGFYEFNQKHRNYNGNVHIKSERNGFNISGDEDAIIKHFNALMIKFLPGHFYKPEGHSSQQYVTFDGNKLKLQNGPSRFQYIELMFPSINAPYPKAGSKGLIDLRRLSKKQLKQYRTLVKKDHRNQKAKKPKVILPLDISLFGHPGLIVEWGIKNIKPGKKRCSICGRQSNDLVKPSGNIYPLFYGQGNFTFDSNWKDKDKICSLCRYFGIFALYSILSNWSRDNNKIVVNCFIPSGQDFKSLTTFTRAFRETREFWEWGNFKTEISYTNRTFEAFLGLMKELTKKLRDLTNSRNDIDFGLSLEEFELSEPEVFYFRMEKPKTAPMPAVRNVAFFRSISYLMELFSRGEKEGIDFLSLFHGLLTRRRDGEVQNYLRNRICYAVCYGKSILLDCEEIVDEQADTYNLVSFLKFYLKEVNHVGFNIERAESIGKSIGEGAFKDGKRMKVIHEIRGANSYDQLLTGLMKVYSRLSGKGVEFYYISDFLKDIEPGNWREVRAYLVINAVNRFNYLNKPKASK